MGLAAEAALFRVEGSGYVNDKQSSYSGSGRVGLCPGDRVRHLAEAKVAGRTAGARKPGRSAGGATLLWSRARLCLCDAGNFVAVAGGGDADGVVR